MEGLNRSVLSMMIENEMMNVASAHEKTLGVQAQERCAKSTEELLAEQLRRLAERTAEALRRDSVVDEAELHRESVVDEAELRRESMGGAARVPLASHDLT